MSDSTPSFWAKTTFDGSPGISVFEHMVSVGCVARCLAENVPFLLRRFHLCAAEVGALAALHDLGKITPGFQRKCEAWLLANDLACIARKGCWETETEPDHGKASHAAIQDFLVGQGNTRSVASHVAAVLGGHHGRLKFLPNSRGIRPPLIGPLSEPHSGINWKAERADTAAKVWNYFQATHVPESLVGQSAAIWWLAGLTTVADWIGSDERYFCAQPGLTGGDPAAIAAHCLKDIGLVPPAVVRGLRFEQIFGFTANDMQKVALDIIKAPGVYVLEAPMGMGKTEAALGAAYHLLESGRANGLYFALPSQATSNRMHLRLNEFIEKIAPQEASSRLIHGNSWLMRDDLDYQPTASGPQRLGEEGATTGRDWFMSAKRAMLAPFGVGTVDQALLGVVAVKHFFVRHFALAGKVVIIDEVHSYDVYTGVLVDILVKILERLGCTVIILSATLTDKRRTQILADSETVTTPAAQPYPLLTGRTEQTPFSPVAATPPAPKKIMVEFAKPDKALNQAIANAKLGGAVLWVCNTVGAAQRQFCQLQRQENGHIKLGLLHSRMIFSHREKREEEWMLRLGKEGKGRCGSILVSTQVVEQSVDLDADLLITELAPTDMLLQRIGRLWRHERQGRPVKLPKICIIEEEKTLEALRQMPPKVIVSTLGGKAHVYAPYVLLRTLEEWKKQTDGISIPSQIRELIEHTYCYRDDAPDSWQKLENEWFGTDSAKHMKAQMSANIWLQATDDKKGPQTRLNELPTTSLILFTEYSTGHSLCVDGSTAQLNGDFNFETARMLHRNLVKTPLHHFEPLPDKRPLGEYFYEAHVVGIVSADGRVQVSGLKYGISLLYTEELGLVVNKSR